MIVVEMDKAQNNLPKRAQSSSSNTTSPLEVTWLRYGTDIPWLNVAPAAIWQKQAIETSALITTPSATRTLWAMRTFFPIITSRPITDRFRINVNSSMRLFSPICTKSSTRTRWPIFTPGRTTQFLPILHSLSTSTFCIKMVVSSTVDPSMIYTFDPITTSSQTETSSSRYAKWPIWTFRPIVPQCHNLAFPIFEFTPIDSHVINAFSSISNCISFVKHAASHFES